MSVLLVSYDLNSPGQNYNDLYKSIGEYTNCHALDSMWFIDTPKSPSDVRDHLKTKIDSDDQLYVFKLRKHWAASSTDHGTKWLKSESRTWD